MRTLITVIFINILFVFAAHTAQAEIVIKGFQLGLDKKEIKLAKKNAKICAKSDIGQASRNMLTGQNFEFKGKCNIVMKGYFAKQMTLGGSVTFLPHVDFRDGVADRIGWTFYHEGVWENDSMKTYENNWDVMAEAFKKKFPSMTCEYTDTQNRMGATFQNETCWLHKGEQTLMLEKYNGNITKGVIVIAGNDFKREVVADLETRTSDL